MDQARDLFPNNRMNKKLKKKIQMKMIYLINTTGLQRLQPRRTFGRGVKSFTICLYYGH